MWWLFAAYGTGIRYSILRELQQTKAGAATIEQVQSMTRTALGTGFRMSLYE